MANDSKRVSELGITTSVSANDRLVVLTNPNTSAQTQTITVGNLGYSLTQNVIPIANATQLGIIKIGDGLVVGANGVVTAPIPIASTVQTGVVKIGNGINVNANGVISVNLNQDTDFTNVTSNVIPIANNTYSLGNSSMQWKSLYVSNNTIYIAGTPLSINANNQLTVNNTLNSTDRLYSNGNLVILQPNGSLDIQNNNISNAQYIEFNNGDMYVGEGMGPTVEANNSLFISSQTSNNTYFGYQGTVSYPGTYQIFVNTYGPNTNLSYAVTLRDDGTLTSDATIISNQDIVSNNNILAGNNVSVSGNLTVNKNIYLSNEIYDKLNRPILNLNALDINTDGGTSSAIFSKTDPAFDGGAGETIFGMYEGVLDGGVSFNNKHSASYIDGGGANQF